MKRWGQTLASLGALLTAAMLVVGCEDDPAGCRDICPVPEPPQIEPTDLVQTLADAYRAHDFAKFSGLLAEDFVFSLDRPNPEAGETWGVTTERRIHSRMFDPEDIPFSDPQLAPDYWLQSVNITLSPQTAFVERTDLYTSFDPPGPLDPVRWIAHGASYGTDVLFNLQGQIDYQITGRAYFVVIADRTKQIGDVGKFLLFRWEDLGRNPSAETEEKSWTGVKRLFY